MINSVKGSRKIKKAQTSEFLIAHGPDYIVMDREQDRLSRVILSIGRLMLVKKIMRRQMFS